MSLPNISGSSSNSSSSASTLFKLVNTDAAYTDHHYSSLSMADMHNNTAVTAVIGTGTYLNGLKVHSDEQAVAQLSGPSHHTAAVGTVHQGGTQTAAATTNDSTADKHSVTMQAASDAADNNTTAAHNLAAVAVPHISSVANINNSSTNDSNSSTSSADHLALDEMVTSTLTLLMHKTNAGDCTESNRLQQAMMH
eukprot:19772-Heterococcus_DN1.PRE.2